MILAVDNTPEIKLNWNIEHVINHFMPTVAQETWKGDTASWTAVFKDLKLNIALDIPKDELFKDHADSE